MAAAIRTFQYAATNAATAINTGISGTVSQSCPQGVLIYSKATNTTNVFIGFTSGVLTTTGWIIEPGKGVQVDPGNLLDISSTNGRPSLSNLFIIGATGGESVCVTLIGAPSG